MGYGDIAAQGNPIIKTPNINKLHDRSARFNNFAVSPSCSPTRAALPAAHGPAGRNPVHRHLVFKIGPSFWWTHRMLPLTSVSIATAMTPHPQLVAWVEEKMGRKPNFVSELPDKVELGFRRGGIEIDPDQILLDCLAAKGILNTEALAGIKAMRQLIADPLPKWLLLQQYLTEEQLHQTFLEICYLPVADSWQSSEVKRLAPALPPGFSEDAGCYCLEESQGAIRLGLSQMPSPQALREIYDRLAGYPLFFQALSYKDCMELHKLLSES